jgi:hypothetical protein
MSLRVLRTFRAVSAERFQVQPLTWMKDDLPHHGFRQNVDVSKARLAG